MAYLQAPLQLHDVRDVEKLACRVLDRRGSFLKGKLTTEQDGRLISFLVEEAWRFSEDFDPSCPDCRGGAGRKTCDRCSGSGRGASFSKLVFERLAKRILDWNRKEFGDPRYPDRFRLESIDDLQPGIDRDDASAFGSYESTPEPLRAYDDLTVSLEGVLEGVDELEPHLQWVMLEVVAPLADAYITREDLAKQRRVTVDALDECLEQLAGELRIAA